MQVKHSKNVINPYRRIAIWSVVAVLIVFGIVGSRFRYDNPAVDPTIARALQNEASVNFDAPLYELVMMPVPRVDSYDPNTKHAVVGMYSWFGIRAGGVTMDDCHYYDPGIHDTYFGCSGGTIDYLF